MAKKILSLRHLGHENFWKIIYDAGQLSSHTCKNEALKGKQVCVLLAGNHTEERDILLQAVADMGGQSHCVSVDVTESNDTTKILQALAAHPADLCVSYGVARAALEVITEALPMPLLCGSSNDARIGAVLGDLTLLRTLYPDMDTLRIAWVGGATPLAHSLIEAAMYVPYELFMALPEWGEPDRNLLGLAFTAGAKIFLTREIHLALDEAHFVYGGIGPAAREDGIQLLRAGLTVDEKAMALARPEARLLMGTAQLSACRVTASLMQSPVSLRQEQEAYTLRALKVLVPWLLNSME
ncbi:MAG: hypothetical protein RRY29_01500 [Desulfovibrionaceae bacterium]